MTAIETVKGPVEVDDLGPTLMHEHVFVLSTEHVQNYGDGSWWDEEARAADAVAKLTALRAKGITTIVDPTVWGIGRYIPRIQRINLGSRGFAAASSGTRITFTRRTMPPSIPTGVRGTDMTKLAELFQASGGKPIRWDGESIQMMHEILDIAAGSVLKIEFVHANSD